MLACVTVIKDTSEDFLSSFMSLGGHVVLQYGNTCEICVLASIIKRMDIALVTSTFCERRSHTIRLFFLAGNQLYELKCQWIGW